MADIFGNFFSASFFNKNGDYMGTKSIKWTFTRPKQKTFEYDGKTYNAPDVSSMFRLSPFPWLVKYWFASYEIDKPDPLKQVHDQKPVMLAEDFRTIITTNVLKTLLLPREGIFKYLTLRNLLILFGALAIAIFLMMGGTPEGAIESVSNVNLGGVRG